MRCCSRKRLKGFVTPDLFRGPRNGGALASRWMPELVRHDEKQRGAPSDRRPFSFLRSGKLAPGHSRPGSGSATQGWSDALGLVLFRIEMEACDLATERIRF